MTNPTRQALCSEIVELNEQIRIQSFALVGPMSFPPDLTMRQLHVMLAAARPDGVTVHELAEALGTSAPTATGLVNRLAAKGLVAREEDADDRRVRHVRLTDAGQETLTQLDSAFDRMLVELVDFLDEEELIRYRDGSRLMLDVIGRAQRERQPTISST